MWLKQFVFLYIYNIYFYNILIPQQMKRECEHLKKQIVIK